MPTHRELANALRFLSIDAIQKANSGHPGMPMGMADIAQVLWSDFLHHNPSNPSWINRDRFVLSNGHGAMLQYALLHLTGYDLSLDDVKAFRQLGSRTPGHPEYGHTPGVETTTGPLGQGLANAVGMALAEKNLAANFNTEAHQIIDHHTYVFAGDGCLMEGVSHEACSLAGTLGLGKLIVFWDDNEISIDGHVRDWFSTDTAKRFQAYHWQVITNVDGHDPEQIKMAIAQAKEETNRPTLICCRTQIGYGSPNKANSASAHGSPLGEEEIVLTRKALHWNYKPFEIPAEYYEAWDAKASGHQLEVEWDKLFNDYAKANPELAQVLKRRLSGKLPSGLMADMNKLLQESQVASKPVATRKASGNVLQRIAPQMPEMLGGSADLTGSNNTYWEGVTTLNSENPGGGYLHYGVREFGMAAIMNGLALHGGFLPYGGTFLVFQTYMANATRMSALMGAQTVYVFTHDSIGLGEDGPTHQPVNEACTLRTTPNMMVWRPCDMVETVAAWQAAIENQSGPAALLLTRQTTAAQVRSAEVLANVKRGGYTLIDSEVEPELIFIATGSEVELAVAAALQLKDSGKAIRVVSMPSCEVFDAQEEAYRESVLPSHIAARVAIEASATAYWHKYVGLQGRVIGLDRFGVSAPYQQAYQTCGITIEALVVAANEMLAGVVVD